MAQRATKLQFITPQSSQSQAPLFIYLPGMDGTGKLFYRQAEGLKKFFTIRCLSIPTHDKSNWQALADQTIELIEKELIVNPCSSVYLCGESFGGCLAIEVALKAPELIKKMILVNPASSFNKRPWLGLGVHINQWLPDFVYQNSTVGFLPFLVSLDRMKSEDSRALLKAMQSLPKEIVSWRIALLRDFQTNPKTLQTFHKPTLMLASDKDRLLPSVAETQELSNYFPNSCLAILPHSGHACLLETDVNLTQMLQQNKFLPNCQPSASSYSSPITRNNQLIYDE